MMKRWTNEQRDRVRATLAAVNEHYPVRGVGDLWTLENPKTRKGAADHDYLVAVLHLAAADHSGANVCAWSVGECRAGCLTFSGRGGMKLDASGWNVAQAARIRRTARMILFPDAFAHDLIRELETIRKAATKDGKRLAVRMNATSDIPWHRVAPDLLGEVQGIADIVYEYTKRPVPDAHEAGIDITYSYPGGQGKAARRYLEAGARIAVVFDTNKGQPLPKEWVAPWGDSIRVVDGDRHDLRFTDPTGVVVGLRAKGRLEKAQGSRLGFVQAAA